ncbi:MAG TPA: protein-tyrosine phosphatase family protein [Ilumatobacter sp.]|nr:protein-tyrosine phosphatase family protein [Ilumatobacter sp.]
MLSDRGQVARDHLLRTHWVQPARVLAGEYPGDRDPELALVKLHYLLSIGVRMFVDLTGPLDGLTDYRVQLDEAAAARQVAVAYVAHPMRDAVSLEVAEVARVVADIRAGFAHGAVYVHCWRGVGRTGRVVGHLLMSDGMSSESATAALMPLSEGVPEADAQTLELMLRLDALRQQAADPGSAAGGADAPA